MPIVVTCSCGKQFQTKDENAGRRARCSQCGKELIIPTQAAGPMGQSWGEAAPDPEFEHEPPRVSGKAVASLVLGLFSIALFCLTGIPAIILGMLGLQEIEKSKGRRTGKGMATTGIVLGGIASTGIPVIAVLIALLLPAVQAAREAARRSQCVNNLKQIGLAMYNYESANNAFPPAATYDAAGKPLLSWRVLLLPYLEQQTLYDRFKLDEPWDSPNNKPLLAAMPPVFACPSFASTEPNTTTYQVLVGPGTMFEPGPALGLRDVTDGTSNTLAVVEAKTAVPWSSPADLAYVPRQPIEAAGSKHPGGYNALFGDGSVKFLKNSISALVLDGLATRNGGEVIGPDSY